MSDSVPWNTDRHAWDGVVDDETVDLYRAYVRDLRVGECPALIVVDAYHCVLGVDATATGPKGRDLSTTGVSDQIARVLATFRARALPVIHVTDLRAVVTPESGSLRATNRLTEPAAGDFDFIPQAQPVDGEQIVYKRRASAFFGTELASLLTERRCDSVVVIGETTSGCVRASVVDGFSSGFHVAIAEEACYDRSFLSHAVNLFDMHHKYADVMSLPTLEALLPTNVAEGIG